MRCFPLFILLPIAAACDGAGDASECAGLDAGETLFAMHEGVFAQASTRGAQRLSDCDPADGRIQRCLSIGDIGAVTAPVRRAVDAPWSGSFEGSYFVFTIPALSDRFASYPDCYGGVRLILDADGRPFFGEPPGILGQTARWRDSAVKRLEHGWVAFERVRVDE